MCRCAAQSVLTREVGLVQSALFWGYAATQVRQQVIMRMANTYLKDTVLGRHFGLVIKDCSFASDVVG